MKIAISATGSTLDVMVDPRFGRCQYFIYVDPETFQFEAAENSSAMAGGGAGIATAQAITAKGVEAVLTGNCGPNAYQVLSAAGVKLITGVTGTVREAVEGYKAGKFRESFQANVPDHFGSRGGAIGMGPGGGMGQGMGRGRRMGAMPAAAPSSGQPDTAQEITSLKTQSQGLAQQLTDIQSRIEKLEKKEK
jgi:predicted Fe-Mo cluster-binding NifX family protein